MVAQVLKEEIARSDAAATGLAVERSPVVVRSCPPQLRTPRLLRVREAARGFVLLVPALTSAMCVSSVLLVLRVATVAANIVAATGLFGTRTPIALVGRCGPRSPQQERRQSRHGDRQTQSMIAKHHGEPPIACSLDFDAGAPGKFTGGPEARSKKKSGENARKSLRRRPI
jgi:hypothetical protein